MLSTKENSQKQNLLRNSIASFCNKIVHGTWFYSFPISDVKNLTIVFKSLIKIAYFCVMKKILPYIKNKYLLTLIGLGVWVIFFDKNDLSTQLELREKVRQLEKERDYFANEIEIINNQVKELTTNPEALERFAREEYLMKRDNEDIFVIVEEMKVPTSTTK